jgi:hypothetical protein
MTRIKKAYRGHSINRLSREPLEKKFARAWEKLNTVGHPTRPDTIDHLIGREPSVLLFSKEHEQERKAINTAIQWLGSPVGFNWLMETLGLKGIESLEDLAKLRKAWKRERLGW